MELPPGRRLRRSSPPPQEHVAADPGKDDRLSALPEDMLLQILARLGCASSAARAGVLARRWRGLWTRIPDLAFRDVPAAKIQAVLARVALPGVSLLDVRLPRCRSPEECKHDESRAKSLLRVAARLSPEVIVFVLSACQCYNVKVGRPVEIVLPRFHRATSIELDTHLLRIKPPSTGELPALERLSIAGNIVHLGVLLDRCPRLRVLRVTFRGVDPAALEEGMAKLEAAVAHGLVVSLLGIDCSSGRNGVDAACFAPILSTAARLYPLEFVFTNDLRTYVYALLPCFHRATSIKMDLYAVWFTHLANGEFLALEKLTLSTACRVTDLFSLVARCPRLRVLKVTADTSRCNNVRINSASLEELELDLFGYKECQSMDIFTSVLKRLKLIINANTNLRVCILAPMVEKVSLSRIYAEHPVMFGFWSVHSMRSEMMESFECKDDGTLNNKGEDACLQLSRSHVLYLDISAKNRWGSDAVVDIAQEMENLRVANFSMLELHLNPKGHVFTSFVLRLLRTRHIQMVVRRIKLVLLGWSEVSETSKCLENCPCNEAESWWSKSISLNTLEDMEINYFRGGGNEIDFVTLIFRWAPMLKRMTIKLARENKQSEIDSCAMTIHNIFLAYPSVNSSVYLSSGERWSYHSGSQS